MTIPIVWNSFYDYTTEAKNTLRWRNTDDMPGLEEEFRTYLEGGVNGSGEVVTR